LQSYAKVVDGKAVKRLAMGIDKLPAMMLQGYFANVVEHEVGRIVIERTPREELSSLRASRHCFAKRGESVSRADGARSKRDGNDVPKLAVEVLHENRRPRSEDTRLGLEMTQDQEVTRHRHGWWSGARW